MAFAHFKAKGKEKKPIMSENYSDCLRFYLYFFFNNVYVTAREVEAWWKSIAVKVSVKSRNK